MLTQPQQQTGDGGRLLGAGADVFVLPGHAEQGLQVGRIIAAKAVGFDAAGITINRYCASGLESIAMATAKIRSGMAECIIAGGTESMSLVPTAGWKTVPSYEIAKDEPDYYLSMGLTAEEVSKQYKNYRFLSA